MRFLVVDLFCGAGGTTTGFELSGVAKVIACVNHDAIAIKSHWANHPDVEHFEEDIRLLNPYGRLKERVDDCRRIFPDAKVILWASLECTNFSIAKGGKPRDADSRTLADHLDKYVTALQPDYVQIENVVEFMSWGELDGNGKPVSRRKGSDWVRWRNRICSHGYYDEWRELNAADFGALTSRNRLFGCFALHHLPIVWPAATHAKNPEATALAEPLRKWNAVKEALDFEDEGRSVFNRVKPLSSKTMQRLFMGCVKHIAGGKKNFLSKYYSGNPMDKNITTDGPSGAITTRDSHALVFITKWNSNNARTGTNNGRSVEEPAPVITTQNRLGVAFITKAFSSNSNKGVNAGTSVDQPCPTIATQGRLGIAQAHFIQKYYSTGGQHNSINEPAASITTKDRLSKVSADYFIDKRYSAAHNNQSVDEPAGAIVTNDKHTLVQADRFLMPTNYNNAAASLENPAPVITASRRHHYLVNPSWGGNPGSVDQPCPVVIARQDKAPLYLITCEEGVVAVPVYDGDCDWTVALKEFMALYGIADIKMRMLKVPELMTIQGFPDGYILHGNQTDQKKFIGNSVCPVIPRSWALVMDERLTTVKASAA